MTYQLGIDLGTTYTAAAIHRAGRAEIATLGDRAAAIPSAVFLKEDETILTGDAASRRAMSEPGRIAREFKRRVGDPTPILLGGSPYSAEALTAKLLRWVVDKVTELEGGPPSHITVSHPANWGPYKKDLLEQAVRMADLDHVTTVTEPEAAAICYASNERIEVGAVVAVYDLGGGTFDAAVLRKTADGWDILGEPEGIERLGGIDFDQAVFSHVRRALAGKIEELDLDDSTAVNAVARLRDDCIAAKEALSADTDATVPVLLPNVSTEVRINRAELESLIRPTLQDTVAALRRALRSAGVEPSEVSAVLLVGGSSRIPLVSQLVGAELGRPVAVDAHPKHSIALGAAMAAAREVHGAAAADVVVQATPVEPAAPATFVPTAPPVFTPTPRSTTTRSRTPMIAGVAALVVVAALAAFFLLGKDGGDDDDGSAVAGPSTSSTIATTTSATGTVTAPVDDFPESAPPVARIKGVSLETVNGSPRYILAVESVGFTPVDAGSQSSDQYEVHMYWNTTAPEEAFGSDHGSPGAPFRLWLDPTTPDGRVDDPYFNVGAKPAGATMICTVLGLGLERAPDFERDGTLDYHVDCAPLPTSANTGEGTSRPGGMISIDNIEATPEGSWLIEWTQDSAALQGGRHLHFYWSAGDIPPLAATTDGDPAIPYFEFAPAEVGGMKGRVVGDAGESVDEEFSAAQPAGATEICVIVVDADHGATDVQGNGPDGASCKALPI
jgi:actin-like ATPase involved in cell morphogenesis